MILKRLLIINLLVGLLVLIWFYFKFELRRRGIIIHLFSITYALSFFYLINIIFTKYFSRHIATSLSIITLTIYHLSSINLYLGFYFAHNTWDHPLTINILLVYLNEIGYLLDSLPYKIPNLLIYSIGIGSLVLIALPFYFIRKKLHSSFKKLTTNFLNKKRILTLGVLYVIIPVLFFNFNWLKKQVNLDDPFITFFLYEYSPQDATTTNDGQKHYIERENYPEGLEFNKKNVILIICDALRNDHFGYNGYNRDTTPFLDSLAQSNNATTLKHFYATSSRSFLGITNTLSSNYSLSHQNFFIHDLLKKQGYNINFIVSGDHSNFYGLKKFYGKNIDFYQDGFIAKKQTKLSINNDLNVIKTLNQLQSHNTKNPSFFYLHFMSTHELGMLNDQFKQYTPNNYSVFNKTIPKDILINDYDNRMLQLDNYLRQSISLLDSKGYLKNSIVIITSDHGQALGERDMVSHCNSVYNYETQIPLIMLNYSENKENITPKVISQFNNQLDVAPSILDLLNLPKPKTWNGSSFFKQRLNNYIFQQEQEYYSCIWYENDQHFQLVFNTKSRKKEIFNISSPNTVDIDIISKIDKLSVQKAQDTLSKFYNLSIQ